MRARLLGKQFDDMDGDKLQSDTLIIHNVHFTKKPEINICVYVN